MSVNTFVPFPAAGQNAATYRGSAIACLLLLALPFTQLGFGFWTSVQGVMFLLVVIFIRKNISRVEFLLFTVIALTMLLSLAGHLYADTLFYSFVRLVRQIIAMYIIVCAATTVSWRPKPYFFDIILPIVVLALSGMVVAQYVSYKVFGWSGLFVPASWFFGGLATLADRLIELGTVRGFVADIRASGPFSEPSYFGFVALSLGLLVVRGVQGRWLKVVLLGSLLVALVCSKSASGVPLFVLLVLFAYRARLSALHWIGIVVAVAAGLATAELLLDFHLVERLINITDPVREPSGYVRLVLPLKHIALVLQHKPFGVPMSEFFTFTSRHTEAYSTGGFNPVELIAGVSTGTDNGFLNLFLTQGVGALVVIGLFIFIVSDKLTLVYLLFVSQFNGDILGPDKAAIIALAISCRRVVADAVLARRAEVPRFTPPDAFGAMQPIRA